MIIDIVCTFSTTTIEAEATSISLVLTFPVTQAPSNICDEVKTCLGISPSGSNTKYLNEKGLWTTPAGGGGVSDGDKGDITVSDSGATWEINDGSVTNAKIDSIDATKVNEDTTHRFVTDTEKTTWNGKQDALGYTPENVANKQAAVSTDVNHYYNAPYVNSLVLGNRRIVAADFTNVSTVGTTTNEIIMKTLLIPANTYSVGKDPIFTSLLTKATGAPSSTTTLRYRVSTTAIPADITLEPILGVLTASVNTNTLFPFNRYNIHIDTGTSTIVANNSAINDDAVFVNNNSLNIDWTVDQYIHLTLQVSATSTAVYTAHKIIAEI